MKAKRRKAVGEVRGDDEELEKVEVKFVKLVADDVGKTNMDEQQHECSSHKSDKKKEGEAKEDTDYEDDVCLWPLRRVNENGHVCCIYGRRKMVSAHKNTLFPSLL